MSTMSPHTRHLVKIISGDTSPHIAKFTTQFCYFFFVYVKSFYRPRAQPVEPILTCDTPADAYLRRVVPFGGKNTVFSHLHPPSKPTKTILGTYDAKPMGNTYLHNCMMHRNTMLKVGTLFDLAKYLKHT